MRKILSIKFLLVISISIGLGLVILFSFILRDHSIDDAYITFRHSKNLVEGNGFSFNPGDRLLSTTSPLHGLILALLFQLNWGTISHLAIILSAVSMVILCISTLYSLCKVNQLYAGVISIYFIATQHWLYRFYPLETIMSLALNMTFFAFAIRYHWSLAGIIAGIAIVVRPDSALLVFAIVLYFLATDKGLLYDLLNFGLICAIVSSLWCGFAFFYYGSPFPTTLAAKSGFSWYTYIVAIWSKILSYLLHREFLSAGMIVFSIIGCIIAARNRSPILILLIWAMLHILAYTLLRISYPFSWYYVPVILVIIVMYCTGISTLIRTIYDYYKKLVANKIAEMRAAAVLGIVCTMFTVLVISLNSSFFTVLHFISSYRVTYYDGARDQIYREVAFWLKENSDPTATVVLAEAGTIGYFSERYIIDTCGLVTYKLRNLSQQGSWLEVIAALEPDYIIGVRTLPPDPELEGFDGYVTIQSFPRGKDNLYEDIMIYKKIQRAL